MKRILVTGASGLIGRHCLPLLVDRGYEVHGVSTRPAEGRDLPEAQWHAADLLEPGAASTLVSDVQPTHLLHLAWNLAPGNWATTGLDENLRWVSVSAELLRAFRENGGERFVGAGSGAEYDWSFGYCTEQRTPTEPDTFYGTCKNALRTLVEAYSSQSGLSSAWGRVFFVYGPHEKPARLVASVIRSLLRDEPARCSHGNQIRDYLYVADVAAAFVALLDSNVHGPVNIASGVPIKLREIVNAIAGKLGREKLVKLGAIPAAVNDAERVVADVGRLTEEVGWTPQVGLDVGVELSIEWWRERLSREEEQAAG
ncbi:MAG: NAD(P)-dependent oxidoreductase [bacterium]|nr:NAD(P)-dependent oxidoreductase [bacterium]